MRAFLKRRRAWATVIFVLAAWLVGFRLWSDEVTQSPLDRPISLSPAGRVDQDIRVRLDGPHELRLEFSIATRPRQQAMTLIGKYSPLEEDGRRQRPSGTSVPLRWSLTDPSGRTVASGDGDTYGRDGHATTQVWRVISRPIVVTPGPYRLEASILRDVPELDGITARLQFALPGGKRTYGWRSDLLFWGGLANLHLIGPLTLLMALILMGLEVRYWLASRRT